MKYFKVFTVGDGYHAAPEEEMEIDSFYIALGNAFQKLNFVSYSQEENIDWFQFSFLNDEEDGYGVAFYTERKAI